MRCHYSGSYGFSIYICQNVGPLQLHPWRSKTLVTNCCITFRNIVDPQHPIRKNPMRIRFRWSIQNTYCFCHDNQGWKSPWLFYLILQKGQKIHLFITIEIQIYEKNIIILIGYGIHKPPVRQSSLEVTLANNFRRVN